MRRVGFLGLLVATLLVVSNLLYTSPAQGAFGDLVAIRHSLTSGPHRALQATFTSHTLNISVAAASPPFNGTFVHGMRLTGCTPCHSLEVGVVAAIVFGEPTRRRVWYWLDDFSGFFMFHPVNDPPYIDDGLERAVRIENLPPPSNVWEIQAGGVIIAPNIVWMDSAAFDSDVRDIGLGIAPTRVFDPDCCFTSNTNTGGTTFRVTQLIAKQQNGVIIDWPGLGQHIDRPCPNPPLNVCYNGETQTSLWSSNKPF